MENKENQNKSEVTKKTTRKFCNDCEATWTVVVNGPELECPECGSEDVEVSAE